MFDYSAAPVATLHGFTDSSFADCPDTGRSTLAYLFRHGKSIISWYSKLGTFVTTCTNHAEYSALALGAKEAEWLVTLFEQLEPDFQPTPVPMYVDNAGVVSMVLNPVDHKANKHIKIACHYTRELAETRVIAPQRVDTTDNLADVFTKPLSGPLFSKFADLLLSPLVGQASISLLRVRYHRRRWYERTASDSESESSDAAYARYEREEHKERGDYDGPTAATLAPEAAAETVPSMASPSHDEFPFEQSVPSPEPVPVPVRQMSSLDLHPMPMPCCARPPPVATIQCMGCEGTSTLDHCNLVCSECQGSEFRWFCKCMVESTFSYAHEEAKLGFHARHELVRRHSPVPAPPDLPFVDPPSGSEVLVHSAHGRAELMSAQATGAPASPLDATAPCTSPSTPPADMPVHSGCCELCAGLDDTCPCWVHYYDDEDSE